MIYQDEKTIVVVGATGRQGREVLRHLVRDGWRAKGLTRDPESKKAIAVRGLGAALIPANMDTSQTRQIHPDVMTVRTWLKGS